VRWRASFPLAVVILFSIWSPDVAAQTPVEELPATPRSGLHLQPAPPCCSDEGWSQATTQGPAARTKLAMAYDSVRHRVVLFGGSAPGYLGDTWEWDGATWTLRATTGPSPRFDHAMAFDSARGRVVLFGGWDSGGERGDTWEWDGTVWALKASSGPSARVRHAMAYDSGHGQVVLFGGFSGSQYKNDTWVWNGSAWTLKASGGPFAQEYHALAEDSLRHRVVLCCGSATAWQTDTWEWDGSTWTRKATTGPIQRYGHSMAFSTACGKVVLFGGFSGMAYLSDTWEWNGVAWTQLATVGPSHRIGAAMAYDGLNGKVVLFGGYPGSTPYSHETWTKYTGPLAADPDFQLSATLPAGNSPTYQLTATAVPLSAGVSFWWQVEEVDPITGAVMPNTTMTNPAAWWPNPLTNVFATYYNNNSAPAGVFYQGHKYRISRGTWSACKPWTAVSKSAFLCNNCRTAEIKTAASPPQPGVR
jgi:Kelch motif/Galactose oxidase, central domain